MGPHAEVMKVALLLYPGFTAHDAVGALQVLPAKFTVRHSDQCVVRHWQVTYTHRS